MECHKCGRELETFQVTKCVTCKQYFCDPCATRFQGMKFCSQNCAHIFYHGEVDDESDMDKEEL